MQLLPFSVRGLVHPNICPALVWSRCSTGSSSADARVFFVSSSELLHNAGTTCCTICAVNTSGGACGKGSGTTNLQAPGNLDVSREDGSGISLGNFQEGTVRYVQYVPAGKRWSREGRSGSPQGPAMAMRGRSTPRPDLPQSPPNSHPGDPTAGGAWTTTGHRPISVSRGGFFFLFSRHVANASIHWRQPPSQCAAAVGSQRYCTETVLRSTSTAMHDPVSAPNLSLCGLRSAVWSAVCRLVCRLRVATACVNPSSDTHSAVRSGIGG